MQQSTFSDWECSLFAKAIEAPSFRAGSVHDNSIIVQERII